MSSIKTGSTATGSGSGELNLVGAPSTATGWTNTGTLGAGTNAPTTTTTAGDLPLAGIVSTAIKITSGTAAGPEASNYTSYAFTTPASYAVKTKVELWLRPGTNFAASEWTLSVYAGATRQALTTDSAGVTFIPNALGKFTAYFDSVAGAAYTVRIARTVNAGANAGVLNIANVIVGPGIQPQGAVVGLYSQYAAVAGTDIKAVSGGLVFSGAVATNIVNIERNGRWAVISWQYKQGTGGSGGTGLYQFKMPSGLTIDTTVVSSGDPSVDNQGNGLVGSLSVGWPAAENDYVARVLDTSTIEFRGVNGTGGTWSSTSTGNFGLTGLSIGMQIRVPVNEWAGSGTVNLAQNDVQYLSSTNGTWDAPAAGTNAVIGPQGSPITGSLTAPRVKLINLPGPLMGGATPKLQYHVTGGDANSWVYAENSQWPFTNLPSIATSGYVNMTSSTQIAVIFQQYATPGSSYNATPGGNYSATLYDAWRVVIGNPGQAVGFGAVTPPSVGNAGSSGLVPAAGLPGRTDGNVVPTGAVGQLIESKATLTVNATPANITTITLPAGEWDIIGIVNYYGAAGPTQIAGAISLNSASITGCTQGYDYNIGSVSAGGVGIANAKKALSLSALSTTVYLVGFTNSNSGTAYSSISARRVS